MRITPKNPLMLQTRVQSNYGWSYSTFFHSDIISMALVDEILMESRSHGEETFNGTVRLKMAYATASCWGFGQSPRNTRGQSCCWRSASVGGHCTKRNPRATKGLGSTSKLAITPGTTRCSRLQFSEVEDEGTVSRGCTSISVFLIILVGTGNEGGEPIRSLDDPAHLHE